MTEAPIEGTSPEDPEDYSYDLAHEAKDVPAAQADGAQEYHEDTYVATETPDRGGDYSYDMAHDLPAKPEW
jgi:hypothetical protein